MVENNLTRELRKFLEKELSTFSLPTQSGKRNAPRIVNGFLPPKREKWEDDFPFVIVRPESGTIEMDETGISVSIIVGCYSEETEGYEHSMNVASRIRNTLTMMPNQTLARRFVLSFPITWKLNSEQPYPLWQVDMTTQWTTKTPEIRSEREFEIYGY